MIFLVFSMVLVESIKDSSQKITCSNYKRILSASLAIAKDLSLYQSTYKVGKPSNSSFLQSIVKRSQLIDQGVFSIVANCQKRKAQMRISEIYSFKTASSLTSSTEKTATCLCNCQIRSRFRRQIVTKVIQTRAKTLFSNLRFNLWLSVFRLIITVVTRYRTANSF